MSQQKSEVIHAVVGASGCGRGIMPLLRAQHPTEHRSGGLVFVDDGVSATEVNGHACMAMGRFLDLPGAKTAVIGIANGRIRERLAEQLVDAGVRINTVRAQNAVVMDDVEIGPGACLSPFVTITSNVRIGQHFHANLYSYVEHDCDIGDYVTFAPRVCCNGNVIIEDHAYIGAGAVIRQGVPGQPLVIGAGATVGMGAIVTRSVPAGTTVVGNPARLHARR